MTTTTLGLTMSSIGSVKQYNQSFFHTSIHTIREHREVTAVLVLMGLPRTLTASILAHEAMHVWYVIEYGSLLRVCIVTIVQTNVALYIVKVPTSYILQ